jgi:hypothetical protein
MGVNCFGDYISYSLECKECKVRHSCERKKNAKKKIKTKYKKAIC